MKALISTVVLWTGIFISFLNGQGGINLRLNDYNQNLNVYHQNELVAVVSGQSVHDIKEKKQWRNLLNSFQDNFKSIQAQIPEYLIYKIEYQKDYNLIVEEVEGMVRYKVNDGQTTFDTYQSKAILKGQEFTIQLNFEKLEDLVENDYEKMIDSAMSKLGKKPSPIITRAYFPKFNYNFSSSKNEMFDKKVKTTIKAVIPITGTIGIYKSNAIYEMSTGIGISMKKENDLKNSLIYVLFGNLWQYDKELDRMRMAALIGLAWKTKRAGTFNITFPLAPSPNEEIPSLMDDVKFRIGGTLHTGNSLAVTANFYYRSIDDFIPSVTFGFSF